MKLRRLVSLREETKGVINKYKDVLSVKELGSREELRSCLEGASVTKKEEILLIAATDDTIRLGEKFKIATLGYLNPEISGQALRGVEYLVEGFEEVEASYMEKIYQRFYHIPWTIAETRRCIIRELSLNDMDGLFALYQDKELTQFIEPLLEKEEETMYQRAYINNMYRFFGYGMWLLFLKDTGELIGRAGLENRTIHGEAEIELGYLIKRDYQRQGYAKEVCQAILNYAKEELEIGKVNCLMEAGNTPSIKLAESLGFSYKETIVEQNRNMLRFIRK